MKLTAPSSEDVIRQTMPMSQKSGHRFEIRLDSGNKTSNRPAPHAGNEEANEHDSSADHVRLIAGMFTRGNAISGVSSHVSPHTSQKAI